MTEFEKFWQIYGSAEQDKEFAERVWHTAQRSIIRVIEQPPYVPKVGDKIRFLSLCHPNCLGKVKEVTRISKETQEVWFVETKQEDLFSSGILGEVELVE